MSYIRYVNVSPTAVAQTGGGGIAANRRIVAGHMLPSVGVRNIFKGNIAWQNLATNSGRASRYRRSAYLRSV